jgi:hypothetical protein
MYRFINPFNGFLSYSWQKNCESVSMLIDRFARLKCEAKKIKSLFGWFSKTTLTVDYFGLFFIQSQLTIFQIVVESLLRYTLPI